MKLHEPFCISARLLPAVQVGKAWISIEYAGNTNDGRQRYRWFIDLPNGEEHYGSDLKSGVGGGSLQQGMSSLLSFLGAAAESWPDGENADLFPPAVSEWASQNSDEIGMLAMEIEESKAALIAE